MKVLYALVDLHVMHICGSEAFVVDFLCLIDSYRSEIYFQLPEQLDIFDVMSSKMSCHLMLISLTLSEPDAE